MPTTAPVRPKGGRQPSNVVSIRDHLLRRSEALAADCPRTQCILAFAGALPTGTTPDEADAMIRDFKASLAD